MPALQVGSVKLPAAKAAPGQSTGTPIYATSSTLQSLQYGILSLTSLADVPSYVADLLAPAAAEPLVHLNLKDFEVSNHWQGVSTYIPHEPAQTYIICLPLYRPEPQCSTQQHVQLCHILYFSGTLLMTAAALQACAAGNPTCRSFTVWSTYGRDTLS
jgi:hypothetical protein